MSKKLREKQSGRHKEERTTILRSKKRNRPLQFQGKELNKSSTGSLTIAITRRTMKITA